MTTMAELTDATVRRRLREEHTDERSREFLRRLRLPDTALCLEIGAGLGSMARWLATDLAPHGWVLATERRPELVETIPRPGIANLRAVRHDIGTEPPPERDLDLIYARFVLEHVPARDAVLSTLAGHLRPGGWLVVEDASFAAGALAGPAVYQEALLRFADGKQGSDYRWADALPAHLAAVGLGEVGAQRVSDLFPTGSAAARFWAALLTQEALRGTLDEAVAGRAVDALVHGHTWFAGPFVVMAAGQHTSDRRGDARS